jgi:hypothetical protein
MLSRTLPLDQVSQTKERILAEDQAITPHLGLERGRDPKGLTMKRRWSGCC